MYIHIAYYIHVMYIYIYTLHSTVKLMFICNIQSFDVIYTYTYACMYKYMYKYVCIYICVCTDVDVHYFPPTNQHCQFQNHHLFSNGHLCHSSILTVLSGWHGLAHKHLPTISGIGIMAAIDSQGRQRGFLRVQDQHFQRWGRNNPFPLILNSPWKPNIWLF